MANLREKQVEKRITKILQKNSIPFFKVAGGMYQISGMADLLIFNNFHTYAVEVKNEFKNSKPKMLQIQQARNYGKHVIWLFVDINNYKWVADNIIKNKTTILKHYSTKQLNYWKHTLKKYETVI